MCIDEEEKTYPHIYIEENGPYMEKYLSKFEGVARPPLPVRL
jgi:hypothetical protein